MNATRILDIFRRASSSHIKAPLGRWNIHNNTETTLKIKYANEDNCGVSGNNYKNATQLQTKTIVAFLETIIKMQRNCKRNKMILMIINISISWVTNQFITKRAILNIYKIVIFYAFNGVIFFLLQIIKHI